MALSDRLTLEAIERIRKAEMEDARGSMSKTLRVIFPEIFELPPKATGVSRITVGSHWNHTDSLYTDLYVFCQVGNAQFTLVGIDNGNRWHGSSPYAFSFVPHSMDVLVPDDSEMWGGDRDAWVEVKS